MAIVAARNDKRFPPKGTLLFGRYRLDEEVGSGSYSRVFRGFDMVHGEMKVAIKWIRNYCSLSRKEREGLDRELRSLGDLQSDHIVPVIEHRLGEAPFDNDLVVILGYCSIDLRQYLEHISLQAKLKHAAPVFLSEKEAQRIVHHLAKGMRAYTARNLMHRDIKPANILLTGDSIQSSNAVWGDFGYVRELPRDVMAATSLGSPYYQSPEMLLHKPYSQQSDLWSIGVTLVEMLTGSPLFKSSHKPDVLRDNILRDPWLNPRGPSFSRRPVYNPELDDACGGHVPLPLSPGCKQVLRGLLQADPRDRWSLQQFFDHPWVAAEEEWTRPIEGYWRLSGAVPASSASVPTVGAASLTAAAAAASLTSCPSSFASLPSVDIDDDASRIASGSGGVSTGTGAAAAASIAGQRTAQSAPDNSNYSAGLPLSARSTNGSAVQAPVAIGRPQRIRKARMKQQPADAAADATVSVSSSCAVAGTAGAASLAEATAVVVSRSELRVSAPSSRPSDTEGPVGYCAPHAEAPQPASGAGAVLARQLTGAGESSLAGGSTSGAVVGHGGSSRHGTRSPDLTDVPLLSLPPPSSAAPSLQSRQLSQQIMSPVPIPALSQPRPGSAADMSASLVYASSSPGGNNCASAVSSGAASLSTSSPSRSRVIAPPLPLLLSPSRPMTSSSMQPQLRATMRSGITASASCAFAPGSGGAGLSQIQAPGSPGSFAECSSSAYGASAGGGAAAVALDTPRSAVSTLAASLATGVKTAGDAVGSVLKQVAAAASTAAGSFPENFLRSPFGGGSWHPSICDAYGTEHEQLQMTSAPPTAAQQASPMLMPASGGRQGSGLGGRDRRLTQSWDLNSQRIAGGDFSASSSVQAAATSAEAATLSSSASGLEVGFGHLHISAHRRSHSATAADSSPAVAGGPLLYSHDHSNRFAPHSPALSAGSRSSSRSNTTRRGEIKSALEGFAVAGEYVIIEEAGEEDSTASSDSQRGGGSASPGTVDADEAESAGVGEGKDDVGSVNAHPSSPHVNATAVLASSQQASYLRSPSDRSQDLQEAYAAAAGNGHSSTEESAWSGIPTASAAFFGVETDEPRPQPGPSKLAGIQIPAEWLNPPAYIAAGGTSAFAASPHDVTGSHPSSPPAAPAAIVSDPHSVTSTAAGARATDTAACGSGAASYTSPPPSAASPLPDLPFCRSGRRRQGPRDNKAQRKRTRGKLPKERKGDTNG